MAPRKQRSHDWLEKELALIAKRLLRRKPTRRGGYIISEKILRDAANGVK